MNDAPQPSARTPGGRRHGPPEGKVIGAVEPARVEALKTTLTGAGFSEETIDILTVEDLDDLEAPLKREGLGGLLERFLLSMGDDLDELEKGRQELANGHVLVGVTASDDDTVHRVRDILRQHGGHAITHYGRWTITTFD